MTSPAAKIPSTEVRVRQGSAGTTYPASFSSSTPWRNVLLGVCPMARKSPPTSISDSSAVTVSRRRSPVMKSSPSTSTTSEFHATRIFGFSRARSTMMGEARKESRRCTMTTSRANLVR